MSPRKASEPDNKVTGILESVDIESSVPVYKQIENQVRFVIAAGKVNGGDRLPSVLELAKRLNVNFNTVGKAYRDLEIMGLVYARRGMGVFIKPNVQPKCQKDIMIEVVSRLHETVSEARASGMSDKDINEIVKKCQAAGRQPYGPVPSEVLALAKKKK
jgi:GntR family transcriptional regulator